MKIQSIPPHALKGRGAQTALPHRFEATARDAFDDGWGPTDETPPPPIRTQVIWEPARSALTRNDSPDIHFDQAINPYRGCEHGCAYCYARPTHSYLNLSPGLDFETRIIAKQHLAAVLEAELSARSYVPRPLNLGSATDCYQPVERELRLTRSLIEVLSAHQHAFSLITKSGAVERDLDLLAPLAQRNLVAVYITITTLDAQLARQLEPRAAAPHRRLRAIRTLAEAGIPVGVSVAPQIPFLNEDMEQVLAAARDAGARAAFYTVLRLPWELDELWQQWLAAHYPGRAGRIMARVRELHGLGSREAVGGPNYDSNFKTRMHGAGVWAQLLQQRFEKTCRKLGLNRERIALDLSAFRRVPETLQPSLF